MIKLIEKYLSNPTEANAVRVEKYLYKHPFAECALSKDSINVLNSIRGRTL